MPDKNRNKPGRPRKRAAKSDKPPSKEATYVPQVSKKRRSKADQPPPQPIEPLIELVIWAKAEGSPPPDMCMDDRREVIQQFIVRGISKIEICELLNITYKTLNRDLARFSEEYSAGNLMQTPRETAEEVIRKFDHLYQMAIKAEDHNAARQIEVEKVKLLQSIGMVVKDPEKIEIDARDRTKEAIIESILARIGDPKLPLDGGGVEEVQE